MSGRTVVLIHGFRFRISIHNHARKAKRRGRNFALFEYDWRLGIDEISDMFYVWCEDQHKAGSGDLVVIAHSLGGLIATRMLQRHTPKFVTHLVTVATPHAGTYAAYISWMQSAKDMRPNSHFIRTYIPEVPGYEHMNVIAESDWIILPYNSCILPDTSVARQLSIPGIGHLNMLSNFSVIRIIYNWLGESDKHERDTV